MRKPDESLEDYIVRPTPKITSEPPPAVWLRSTGAVEVLKPLTRAEARSRSVRYRLKVRYQPLWFRRFVVVGSGALVMTAFVLVSAILVGINDRTAGPEVATSEETANTLTLPEELFSFDLSTPLTLLPTKRSVLVHRSNTTRRPRMQLAAIKPRRQLRTSLRPKQPKFVPTTLVIYAKNGVINTRIEPWVQASYKKTPTFSN